MKKDANRSAQLKLTISRIVVYAILIFLSFLCLFFFYLMFVNSTVNNAVWVHNDMLQEIESKGNQNERLKIPMERFSKYFPRGTSPKQVEETIFRALEYYSAAMKRKRENRDSR